METELTGSQAFMLNGLMDSEIARLSGLLLKTEADWHREIIIGNIEHMKETKKVIAPLARQWLIKEISA